MTEPIVPKFVVGTEPLAARLRAAGCDAVAWPSVGHGDDVAVWAAGLRDREVVVAEGGCAVAQPLLAAGARVRLWTARRAEVEAWLEAGATGETFQWGELWRVFTPLRLEPPPEGTRREGATAVETPALVSLSTVTPRVVEWVRPQRWPRGKVVLLVGEPGLGKSWLLLDAAARISTGADWPEGGPAPRGPVVILTAEDGLDDTVVPRLAAMGADLSQITALTAIRRQHGAERTVSLATDLPHLTAAVERLRPVVVMIDPLTAYLGSIDSHTDAEVRGLLAQLAKLAAAGDTLVLALMHLNKAVQMKALYRVGGSVAFTAAARAVLAVVADPDREARRLFVPVKMNLGPMPPALAFTLTAAGLAWEADPVGRIDLDAALRGPAVEVETPDTRRGIEDAMGFLRELLAGEPVRVDDIRTAAREAGHAWRTVERAKERLGVQSRRVGFVAQAHYVWELMDAVDRHADAVDRQPPQDVADLAVHEQPGVDSHETAPTSSWTANATREEEVGGPRGPDSVPDRGARLLAALEALGWPALPRRPGVVAGGSEAAWETWMRRAGLVDLDWLETMLEHGDRP